MDRVVDHSPLRRVFWLSLAGVFGAVLAVVAALWAKYGTAIFFEMVRTGIMSCFG